MTRLGSRGVGLEGWGWGWGWGVGLGGYSLIILG
jgi:hypothetical protein